MGKKIHIGRKGLESLPPCARARPEMYLERARRVPVTVVPRSRYGGDIRANGTPVLCVGVYVIKILLKTTRDRQCTRGYEISAPFNDPSVCIRVFYALRPSPRVKSSRELVSRKNVIYTYCRDQQRGEIPLLNTVIIKRAYIHKYIYIFISFTPYTKCININ